MTEILTTKLAPLKEISYYMILLTQLVKDNEHKIMVCYLETNIWLCPCLKAGVDVIPPLSPICQRNTTLLSSRVNTKKSYIRNSLYVTMYT